MVILRKTIDDLNSAAFDHLLNSSPITSLAPGSIARALVESVNRQIADLYDVLEIASTQTFVSLASGTYLDLIGRMLGVRRQEERAAAVVADDRILRFYVETGTLGAKLPHPIDPELGQVPGGVTVRNLDSSIAYTTDGPLDFPVAAREAYVPATASASGSSGNIGRGELTVHNLGVSGVLVRNEDSIRTGRQAEDDDSYRERITSQVLAAQTSNETAIRLAALSIPGVADTILTPGIAGAGSFRILLIPFGNRVPLQTITQVTAAVTTVAAYGIRVFVQEPDYIPFSLTLRLHTDRVPASEIDGMRQRVENAVRSYVGDLRPGERFVPNRLRSVALATERDVLDVSILELCIGRKATLLAEHVLGEDEVLVPDGTMEDPVRILA